MRTTLLVVLMSFSIVESTGALVLAAKTWGASSSAPTQKDIFELRSACAATAATQSTPASAWMTPNAETGPIFHGNPPPGIVRSYRGHYDADRNRCVLKGMTFVFNDDTFTHVTTIESVIDAQSAAGFVSCTTDLPDAHTSNPTPQTFCEVRGDSVTKEKAKQRIDEMMGDDK